MKKWMFLLVLLLGASSADAATVPDCVGETVVTCQAEITAAGLLMGSQSVAYNESVAKDLVSATVPTGGSTVTDGSAVDLVISGGPQGHGIWNITFWGILRAFLVGTYIGLFVKLTNRT